MGICPAVHQLRVLLVISVIVCIPIIMGCGGRSGTAQVSGKVVYKDGTVPKGGVCLVQFQPTADTTADIRKAASGNIESDGTFQVYTRKPGDGIFLGKYAVIFSVWKGPMEPISFVDQRYTKAETTPFIVEVVGDRDDLLFEIAPAN